MTTWHSATRQQRILAALISLPITLALPVLLYMLTILISGDLGGPLNLVIVPCINCVSALVVAGLSSPLCYLTESVAAQLPTAWRLRVLSAQTAGILLAFCSIVAVTAYVITYRATVQQPESDLPGLVSVFLLGGTPLLIGTVLQWFLLRILIAAGD
jgi:hypothetical protein